MAAACVPSERLSCGRPHSYSRSRFLDNFWQPVEAAFFTKRIKLGVYLGHDLLQFELTRNAVQNGEGFAVELVDFGVQRGSKIIGMNMSCHSPGISPSSKTWSGNEQMRLMRPEAGWKNRAMSVLSTLLPLRTGALRVFGTRPQIGGAECRAIETANLDSRVGRQICLSRFSA